MREIFLDPIWIPLGAAAALIIAAFWLATKVDRAGHDWDDGDDTTGWG